MVRKVDINSITGDKLVSRVSNKNFRDNFGNIFKKKKTELRDGEPCPHTGCLNHITHPCEGCGRVAGKSKK